MAKHKNGFRFWRLLPIIILLGALAGIYFGFSKLSPDKWNAALSLFSTKEQQSKFVAFDLEIFDKIKENFWNKVKDDELAELYRLAVEKVSGKNQTLESKDKTGVSKILETAIANAGDDAAKKTFALNIANVVLYNLAPIGRNALYTTKQEKQLRDTVQNIDRSKDLYSELGVKDSASNDEIAAAFKAKETELKKDGSKEARDKLKELSYAKNVLTNTASKTVYDSKKIEPTVFSRILPGNVLYVAMTKISPTTLEEFAEAVNANEKNTANSLILDFRGNIGGALDFTQYFLGLFFGQNQYAFDLYHQGDLKPVRTATGKLQSLAKYKKIIALTDSATQSTAELISASLKRFHTAVVVGEKTRGWGSVENTIPIKTSIDDSESYSILLVLELTLRDDGQPVEINGVLPDVSIADKNWKKSLAAYANDPLLIDAVAGALKKGPKDFAQNL